MRNNIKMIKDIMFGVFFVSEMEYLINCTYMSGQKRMLYSYI